MIKVINRIISWIIIALVFLLPVFFLPITTEFYTFNKQTLLISAVGLLLILWALKMVVQKRLVFKKTSLDLPIVVFALAFILTAIIVSPNKVEAILGPTSLGTILALTAFYFVITNNLKSGAIRSSLSALIASASLLGLISLYQFLGLGESLTSLSWLKNALFTPTGGPLILVSYLVVGLALSINLFIKKFGQEEWLSSILYLIPTVLIALGLGFTVYQILPGKENSLAILPYRDGWAIAVEAFKQNPLFGVGPGNYLSVALVMPLIYLWSC
jgi:hypothetical protein